MLRTEFTIETLGEADIATLTDSARCTFFDTLLSAILGIAMPVT